MSRTFARTLLALLAGLAVPTAHAQMPSMLDVTATAMVVGELHSCALDASGGVYCWGTNSKGQLGDNSTTRRNIPVAVVDDTNTPIGGVVALTAGQQHNCALTAVGGVLCWGNNVAGQLGDNSTTNRSTAVPVVDDTNTPIRGIVAIAAGSFHTCALTTTSGVLCWGSNFFGQLGDDSTTDHPTPVAVVDSSNTPIRDVTAIALGEKHSCALGAAGGVRCWGLNTYGALGDNSTTRRYTPVDVVDSTGTPISGVAAISLGDWHSCAVDTSGGARCWGWNEKGQLGDNSTTSRRTPVAVVDGTGAPISGVVAIAASERAHTCAVGSDGGLRCWGWNNEGQLGDNSTADRLTPVAVVDATGTPVRGVAEVDTGYFHTCALRTAGGLLCWGHNEYGEFGNGTDTGSLIPVAVSGRSGGALAIAAGFVHTCAMTSAHGVKCWGFNDNGQLGDGTTTGRSAPVDVVGLAHGASAVVLGDFHSCALTTTGRVKCWGDNAFGQLGDGTNVDRSTPVDVVDASNAPISGMVALTAGGFHTCALDADGGVHCWGLNSNGQLGRANLVDSNIPVDVVGMQQFVGEISAGALHTCARGRESLGWVYCWGSNGSGQLGDNSTSDRTTPVPVVDGSNNVITDFAGLSAGGSHTCANDTAGGVRCWGANGHGELGDNSTTARHTPVAVVDASNTPITGVSAISMGWRHGCALGTSGDMRCWGFNTAGQIGDGSNTDRLAAVTVMDHAGTPLGGLESIAAGGVHTCALNAAKLLRCWGSNGNGQLGTDGSGDEFLPVAIRSGQSIDFAPPVSLATGSSLTLDATASGGGPMPIVFDTWTPDTCTVSGNVLTAAGGPGSWCGVRASRAGGADGESGTLAAAPQQLRLVRILRATPTLAVSSNIEPSVYGQTVLFTAHLDGASTPTGDVSFCADATTTDAACSGGTLLCTVAASASPIQCAMASLEVGSHVISAYFPGDAGNAEALSAPLTQHVDAISTTTTIDAPGPIVLGEPVLVTVAVAPVPPGIGAPPGEVEVDVSDSDVSCVIHLPATTCSFVPDTIGALVLTATYLGDIHYSTSSGSTGLVVDPPPELVLVSGSSQETPVGTSFDLPLTVRVVDGFGAPLANVAVDFSAPSGGPGALLSATTVDTDLDGFASVTAVANGQVGSYEVFATFGSSQVGFDLANTAPPGALAIGIDDGRAFARYGQTLDYVVTIANGGAGAAAHVGVDTTLAPQLDVAFATWTCLDAGEPGVTCTPSGNGPLVDSEVTIPPGASVTYVVSAPIRPDAAGPSVETQLEVSSPTQALSPVSDLTGLVIFRGGFDGSGDAPGDAPLEPLAKSLEPGDPWLLELPLGADNTGRAIATVLRARSGHGDGFRIERLRPLTGPWLRLVQCDANGAEYPWPWTRHDRTAPIELLLGTDDAQRPSLHVAGIAEAILGNDATQSTWHVELANGVVLMDSP